MRGSERKNFIFVGYMMIVDFEENGKYNQTYTTAS
jgi:hypothetical protein